MIEERLDRIEKRLDQQAELYRTLIDRLKDFKPDIAQLQAAQDAAGNTTLRAEELLESIPRKQKHLLGRMKSMERRFDDLRLDEMRRVQDRMADIEDLLRSLQKTIDAVTDPVTLPMLDCDFDYSTPWARDIRKLSDMLKEIYKPMIARGRA